MIDLVARRTTYDLLIVSHVLPIGTAALIAGIVTRKPFVVIVHGMDVGLAKQHAIKRFVVRMILRHAKLVITNSNSLRSEVRDTFAVTRCLTAYPPVSLSAIDVSRTCGTALRLLTVARLVARKGHLRVLEALVRLQREHPERSFEYVIVGDGPMRESIEQSIRNFGLKNVRMVIHANDDELAIIYASSDIFVLPIIQNEQDREGFGMVFLEAAAHAVPSIATDMSGVNEAILNGKTGVLVPDGDIAALADTVYGLSVNPERRRALGKEAQRRVLEEFTPERQFGQIRDLL